MTVFKQRSNPFKWQNAWLSNLEGGKSSPNAIAKSGKCT